MKMIPSIPRSSQERGRQETFPLIPAGSSMIPRIFLALAATCTGASVSAQTCQPNIRASTPASRFVVDANHGTVLDKKTGLMWKRCVEGLSGSDCSPDMYSRYSWGEAMQQADQSDFAGYNDWRLPNHKELRSLVEIQCYDPAINAGVFPNTPSDAHWSGSPSAFNSYFAWHVYFGYGNSNGSSRNGDYLAVRLVRGGQ